MTSLLGKLSGRFRNQIRREDLFTEAVARLFERDPGMCLEWLGSEGLISSGFGDDAEGSVRVQTQKRLPATDTLESAGTVDMFVEVQRSLGPEEAGGGATTEAVMIESKIGSREGERQLGKYAEYLAGMEGYGRKTLLYVTHRDDPKDEDEILSGLDGTVKFKQLRWHAFHRFLGGADGVALAEEVRLFMEEQGMSRTHRFSDADLAALSSMPRASAILSEALGGKVRERLEKLAGHRIGRDSTNIERIRDEEGYWVYGYPSEKSAVGFWAGFWLIAPDGYPRAQVGAYADPGAEEATAALRRVARLEGWEGYNLHAPDEAAEEAGVQREMSLALVLAEEDHLAALQRFFVESFDQIGAELAAFKEERPGLPWAGE